MQGGQSGKVAHVEVGEIVFCKGKAPDMHERWGKLDGGNLVVGKGPLFDSGQVWGQHHDIDIFFVKSS